MEVILLERVAKLGQMGEVVRVKDGFARNFLLKRGNALRATADNRSKFEGMKADLEALSWLVEQATADKNPTGDSNVRHAIDPKSMVNINIGLLLGSHAKVAQLLDEGDILLDLLGGRIAPRSQAHRPADLRLQARRRILHQPQGK